MRTQKQTLLSSTVLHLFLGASVAAGAAVALADMSFARGGSQARSLENPAAVAKPQTGAVKLAACKACNPCAAKKGCGACNPCAAKKACNPCNPCAAKKGCGACNPCSPCGAKGACGACNPCNPCAGGAASYSASCTVPRLLKAALCNPCAAKKACGACNPCAAKKACGACNPCAAKKACSACNPCAAKKACNPCNPCAAKGACGACNPCGGAAALALTTAEARSAYECLIKELVAGYGKSGLTTASHYKDWKVYSTQPYVSDTHGGRFVQNYGNVQAKNYGKYEDVGRMAVGAVLAKDSFAVHANGKISAGPLFLMEKMPAGFNAKSGNWRYTMVMPNGAVFGTTGGKGDAKVGFCIECHASVAEDQDSLMFLPEEYRVSGN